MFLYVDLDSSSSRVCRIYMVVQSEWPSRVIWLNCWNWKVKRTLHQKISQNTRDESQSSAFVGQSGNVASISRTDRVVESADDRTRLLHKSVPHYTMPGRPWWRCCRWTVHFVDQLHSCELRVDGTQGRRRSLNEHIIMCPGWIVSRILMSR